MKGKLKVFQSYWYPNEWCWQIIAGRVYICSNHPLKFAGKAGALKSARRAAERLGIDLEETA
jgi:hypothetical protein